MGSLPPVLTVTELADDSVTASANLFALGEDGDFDTWGGDSNTGLLSPGRAQITIGRVQALQQMFLAMEDRRVAVVYLFHYVYLHSPYPLKDVLSSLTQPAVTLRARL